MKLKRKIKAIWKVLMSDNFLVCTTKDMKRDRLSFFHSYTYLPGNTVSGTIFKIMIDRLNEINENLGKIKKEDNESKTKSDLENPAR